MARETRFQSMVLLCLTLGIIRYISRVKWRNMGEGVAPTLTPRCNSFWKGSLHVAFDCGRQLYFLHIVRVNCQSSQVHIRCQYTLSNLSSTRLEKKKHILVFCCVSWLYNYNLRGARGVMVIVVGNGHSETSSNPKRSWLHFTWH